MRQSKLLDQIRRDVQLDNVPSQFRAKDFPYLNKSPSFLSKHADGNGKYSEFFERIERGLYRLK